jgi:hypothetical protein
MDRYAHITDGEEAKLIGFSSLDVEFTWLALKNSRDACQGGIAHPDRMSSGMTGEQIPLIIE